MDNESTKFDKKKQILLNRALIDIKNFGFNKKMLHIAAKNCSISDGELGRLFPEGIFELKQYFFSTIDKKMLKEPPFTDIHDQGLAGVFAIDRANEIISIIKQINENAG